MSPIASIIMSIINTIITDDYETLLKDTSMKLAVRSGRKQLRTNNLRKFDALIDSGCITSAINIKVCFTTELPNTGLDKKGSREAANLTEKGSR